MKVLIGSDPEFFMHTPAGDPVPAELLLPSAGTVAALSPGGKEVIPNYPFYDGFQGEITTTPVADVSDASKHLRSAVAAICELREKRVTPFVAPAITVPARILEVCPPSVFEFGCSPSVNAYSKEVRNTNLIQSLHAAHEDIMMAGGHIHLGMPGGGYRKKPADDMIPYAAVFDLAYPDVIRMFEMLGVTLLTAIEASDQDKAPVYRLRRKFYGLSGEYRHTKYGVEMRSPSCVWLMSPILAEMIYAAAAIAYYSVFTGYHEEVLERIPVLQLVAAINHSDVAECLAIHERATGILQDAFGNKQDLVIGAEAKYKGIWECIKEIRDLAISRINAYAYFGSLEQAWQVA